MRGKGSYKTDKIGKYDILSTLGSGAMGVVYKGYDPDIDRAVALKMLHEHLLSDDQGGMLERFRQEVKAAARCSHANIVTVFDFGVHNNSPYMVMEFVDGVDLRSLLKQGPPLGYEQSLDIILQVLDALDYAHSNGVVHRDIKPANILLEPDGKPKVTDFGVARIDTSELTNVGDVIGTPRYMPPEALRGGKVDGRSDQYSAAVVLTELLAGFGTKPKTEAWTEQVLMALLQQSSQLTDKQADDLSAIIICALSDDPMMRYPSCREFATQLRGLQGSAPAAPVESDSLLERVTQIRQQSEIHQPPPKQATQTGIQLPDNTADILNQSLTPYLGPLASRMIRSMATTSPSLKQLIHQLSDQIRNEKERKAFLKQLESTGLGSQLEQIDEVYGSGISSSNSSSGSSAVSNPVQIEAPQLEQITRILAFYAGPLAKRMVKKALQASINKQALINKLAGRIEDPNDREQFIAKAQECLSD